MTKKATASKHDALLESVDMPIPYVVGPDPLDVQIDVMLDCLWAEKRAKLKAHLKPLLSDAETWDMVKHIVRRGLA